MSNIWLFNLANERSQMKTYAPTLGCTFKLTLDYELYLQILFSDQDEKSAECLICLGTTRCQHL